MARINIEPKLFERGEWMTLLIKTGDPDTALGALTRVFLVAQRFWFPDKKKIPKDVWEKEALNNAVIEAGLATKSDDGIYVHGSKDQFAWLFEASEKGKKGGRVSAENRKKKAKKTKKTASTGQPQVEQGLSTGEAEVNLGEASSSLLFTPPLSSSSGSKAFARVIENDDPPPKVLVSPEGPTATAITWRAYKAAYESRWKNAPPWNAKTAGQLKHFIARVPAEDAPEVARFYLTHNDRYYVKALHPVGLLLRDAEKLFTEWKTNRKVTDKEAQSAESADHYREQMKRLGVTGG